MSEVDPFTSPLDMLVEHRSPPYDFAFKTDIIEAPGLLQRIEPLPPRHQANLLLAMVTSLPGEEADWKEYGIEPSPNVPCSPFAVGTIFGACALNDQLSEAFIQELEASAAPNALFASNSRLAYVALQRVKGAPASTDNVDRHERYEKILKPYLPPVDVATRAFDLLYTAMDSVKTKCSKDDNLNENLVSPLLNATAQISELLESSGLNPQERDQLKDGIAALTGGCLAKITEELSFRTVIKKGGSCKDRNYASLIHCVTTLHDSLGAAAFLPASIMHELDAMAATKAEEYSRPRAIGEAPHDEQMLAYAHTIVDTFLDSLIERRQTATRLDTKTLQDAQTIIKGRVHHLPVTGATAERACAALRDKAQTIFPSEYFESGHELNASFKAWNDKRQAALRRISRLEAKQSPERLPETIHDIRLGISDGEVLYKGTPEKAIEDVLAYLKHFRNRRVLVDPHINAAYRQSSISLESVDHALREWHKDTSPHNTSYYIEWNESTARGPANPHLMTILKEANGSRRVAIIALDDRPPSLHQQEIEVFAQASGQLVDYDELPRGYITVRPELEVLETLKKPDKELVVPIFLDEIADAYAHILGFDVNELEFTKSYYGHLTFRDEKSTIHIMVDDFTTADGVMFTLTMPTTHHEGIKRLGLKLPSVTVSAHSRLLTPAEIRKSVERARAFSQKTGIQPVPAPWISKPNGMIRPYNP